MIRHRALAALATVFLAGCIVPALAFAGGSTMRMSSSTSRSNALLNFSATLNAAQEVPKETGAPASASGKFTATLNVPGGTNTSGTLTWSLTFSHLTGAATAAHIHAGAIGKSGAVIVPLCGPCKSSTHGTVHLTKQATAQLSALGIFPNYAFYVNVHTVKNPNGEIRGQISRSPAH
jgi:hypothetical protein